jgi:prepilin-type processing-associated H-X9-DG protein
MYFDDEKGLLGVQKWPQTWLGTLQTNYSAIAGVRYCPAASEKIPWGGPTGNQGPSSLYPNSFGTADYPWSVYAWSGRTFDAQGSYGLNFWCSRQGDNAVDFWWETANFFYKDTDIMSPSTTPYFADANWMGGSPHINDKATTDLYNGQDGQVGPTGTPGEIGRFEIARHWGQAASAAPRNWPAGTPLPGRSNIGFADGHAQAPKLSDLRKLTWNKTWP